MTKSFAIFFFRPVDLLVDDTFVYIYAAAFGCTSFAVLELILDPEELKSVSSDILPWIRGNKRITHFTALTILKLHIISYGTLFFYCLFSFKE